MTLYNFSKLHPVDMEMLEAELVSACDKVFFVLLVNICDTKTHCLIKKGSTFFVLLFYHFK